MVRFAINVSYFKALMVISMFILPAEEEGHQWVQEVNIESNLIRVTLDASG